MDTFSIQRRDGLVLDSRAAVPGARLTDDNRRIYRALAYDTTAVDRHGTIIEPAAFRPVNLDNFPLILWHSDTQFPVGRVIEWNITEQGPVAGFVFADTAEAREAELLVATGFLNGVSIGFIGYEAENQKGITVYTDVEVIELSLTPTPSSRAALVNLERSIRSLAGDTPAVEVAPETSEELAVQDDQVEAEEIVEAATVASDESRLAQLTSLLNRLR
jgi:HK97 family phage prohead protease